MATRRSQQCEQCHTHSELYADGRPCPWCHHVSRVNRAWRLFDWVVIVVSLSALVALWVASP